MDGHGVPLCRQIRRQTFLHCLETLHPICPLKWAGGLREKDQRVPFDRPPSAPCFVLPPKNSATPPRTENNEEPLQGGEIAVPKALGGGNHDALHQNDSELAAGSPKIATTVVKHEQGGRRVQRFDGRIASSEFGSVKNARTVSVVASKHPTAYQKLSERFVLGGREKTRINFHVGCHCTDTIIGLGFFKHGKVWFNGSPTDPTLSEFAPKLAVIWFVAGRNTVTGQFARDRDFIDRCWHGHIGDALI